MDPKLAATLFDLFTRFITSYEKRTELDAKDFERALKRDAVDAGNKAQQVALVEKVAAYFEDMQVRQAKEQARIDEMKKNAPPVAFGLDPDAKMTFLRLKRPTFGETPDSPLREPSAPTHTDTRGFIFNVCNAPVGSAVVITSKKGSVRANHYHKEDSHLCFVVSGGIDYLERPVGSLDEPKKFHYAAGQSFFTGPMVEHAMKFTEDTVFLTLGELSRRPEEYEADLVRLEKPLATADAS